MKQGRVTRFGFAASLGGVVAIVSCAYACRTPTEMSIRVRTAVPCSSLRGIVLAVAQDSAEAERRAATKFYAASTRQCDSESEVGTLVVTPGTSGFAIVVVAGVDAEATACVPPDYQGCIVARRRLSFVEHESLDVPILLTRDCLDVPCNTESSCVHGNCKAVDTTCDQNACTQVGVDPNDDGGADGGGDAGASADGRASDATLDAVVDAPVADVLADAPATDARFDGSFTCTSSPGCFGAPTPCSCGGAVRVNGTRMTTMTLDCPSGAFSCTCSIEGQFVKTVPSVSMCTSTEYGSCCSP